LNALRGVEGEEEGRREGDSKSHSSRHRANVGDMLWSHLEGGMGAAYGIFMLEGNIGKLDEIHQDTNNSN
jgi:hypothetical protein